MISYKDINLKFREYLLRVRDNKIMKILICGSWTKGGLDTSFAESFKRTGNEVYFFDEQKACRSQFSFLKNRVTNRIFHHFFAIFLQKEFLKKAISEKPELILIFKGFHFSPKFLKKIKEILPDTILFNWNPDNPFNTWHHGNSSNWIRESIPFFDTYFMWGKFLGDPLLKAGAKRFEYLPCGYDVNLHYPVEINEQEKKEFGSDIAFVGSWDEERETWLNHLSDYDLKIWGNSWQKANKKLQKKWQGRAAMGEEFSKVCNASKININIIRKQNGSAHNMRTFEIPACRGFALSMRTEETVGFFAEDKEAAYFSTPEELKQKIDFYLKNEDKRKAIAEAGYLRLINSDYNYDDRVKIFLNVFEEIKKNRRH